MSADHGNSSVLDKVRSHEGPEGADDRDADRSFLLVFFSAFLSFLVLCAALSLFADPWGRFGTGRLPPSLWLDRDEKVALFQKEQFEPEAIVLGSSRSMKLSPVSIEALTAKRAFNFALNSARAEDHAAVLSWLHSQGKVPQLVLLGLDPEALHPDRAADTRLARSFLAPFAPSQIPCEKPSWGADLWGLESVHAALVSVKHEVLTHHTPPNAIFGTGGSLTYTIWERQVAEGQFDFDAAFAASVRNYRSLYRSFDRLDPVRIEVLEASLESLREQGTVVIAWVPPLHPRLLLALSTTEIEARQRDAAVLLLDLQARSLLHLGSIPDLDEGFWFDGAHVRDENAEILLRSLLGPAGTR